MEPSSTHVGPRISARHLAPAVATACLFAVGGFVLSTRSSAPPAADALRAREPGLDRAPAAAEGGTSAAAAGGRLIPGPGKAGDTAGARGVAIEALKRLRA